MSSLSYQELVNAVQRLRSQAVPIESFFDPPRGVFNSDDHHSDAIDALAYATGTLYNRKTMIPEDRNKSFGIEYRLVFNDENTPSTQDRVCDSRFDCLELD